MTPHRMRKPGIRAVQAAGAVLAGVLLSSCGQLAEESNAQGPVPETEVDSGTPPESSTGGGTPEQSPSPVTSDPAGTSSTELPDSGGENATPEGVERCHTSMLSGVLQRGDPGAGQRYAELVLTNTSAETCTLYGYGGLRLVDSNGAPLATELSRDANPGPTMIELAPDESASKTLHWSAVPHGDEPTDGPCQPTPSGAAVIPPDETDPLMVDWAMGPVCGSGSIDGTAYHQ